MPDDQGMLSPDEQAKLINYFKSISIGGVAPNCEFCQTNNWGVMPHVVSPMPLGPMHKWKQFYPVCMVACTNCGNTKYFAAVKAGVTWEEKGEASKPVETVERVVEKAEAKSG